MRAIKKDVKSAVRRVESKSVEPSGVEVSVSENVSDSVDVAVADEVIEQGVVSTGTLEGNFMDSLLDDDVDIAVAPEVDAGVSYSAAGSEAIIAEARARAAASADIVEKASAEVSSGVSSVVTPVVSSGVGCKSSRLAEIIASRTPSGSAAVIGVKAVIANRTATGGGGRSVRAVIADRLSGRTVGGSVVCKTKVIG